MLNTLAGTTRIHTHNRVYSTRMGLGEGFYKLTLTHGNLLVTRKDNLASEITIKLYLGVVTIQGMI